MFKLSLSFVGYPLEGPCVTSILIAFLWSLADNSTSQEKERVKLDKPHTRSLFCEPFLMAFVHDDSCQTALPQYLVFF